MAQQPTSTPSSSGNNTIGSERSELAKSDILDILMSDDDVKPKEEAKGSEQGKEQSRKPEKEQPKEEEQEEEFELSGEDPADDEDEDKEKETDEEARLELKSGKEDEYHVPIPRSAILKKYPDLFKTFPYLEIAYYRDKDFTEIVGTPDDAKELVTKADTLDKYYADINKGSIETILKDIKDNNTEAYYHIIDNYLPMLAANDQNAYTHVVSNVVRNAVAQLMKEGKQRNDEELQDAAKILNSYIFGTEEPQPPQRISKSPNPEISEREKELQARERRLIENKFNETHQDLNTKVSNILRASVSEHIDPRGQMSEYEKRAAIKEAVELAQDNIANDRSFLKTLDGLWKQAFKREFDRASVNQIRSAYLSKARTVLPETIKKVRSEALGKVRRTNAEEGPHKGPARPRESTPSKTNNSGQSTENRPSKKQSTLEFFNAD